MAAHATGKWKKIHSRCTEMCTRCSRYARYGIFWRWHRYERGKTAVPTGILIRFSIQHVSLGVNTSMVTFRLFISVYVPRTNQWSALQTQAEDSTSSIRYHKVLRLWAYEVAASWPLKNLCGQVPTPNCLFGLFLVSHSNCLSPSSNRR